MVNGLEIARRVAGGRLQERQLASGVTFYAPGGRVFKVIPRVREVYIEFNVPVGPADGLTILSEEEARARSMGTCHWVYRGTDPETAERLLRQALDQIHLASGPVPHRWESPAADPRHRKQPVQLAFPPELARLAEYLEDPRTRSVHSSVRDALDLFRQERWEASYLRFSAAIERYLSELLSMRRVNPLRLRGWRDKVDEAIRLGILPKSFASAHELFKARNQTAHGGEFPAGDYGRLLCLLAASHLADLIAATSSTAKGR